MTKRDRLMLLAVLGVALLGGFWMLVVSPQRKAAAEAEAAVVAAQTDFAAAQQRVTAGKAAREQFERDRTAIVKLGRVVPETDDIPTLLTQLQAIADQYDVKFKSYKLDASGATSSSSTGTQTGAGATGTTPEGTRSTDTVAPLYTPGSVEIEGGLGRTPISIELVGKYFNLERYLRAVQRFAVLSAKQQKTTGRLIIVDGFSYVADTSVAEGTAAKKKATSKSPDLLATLSTSVYFAPPLEAPAASSAAPSGSAPTPASSTTTPSTSTGAAAVGGLR